MIDLARVKGKRVEVVIEDTPEGPNFDSSRNLITLSTTPSVITGLHELSHKLFGGGELTACRFSVHHFKKCFPIAYEKLKWNGHMLTKLQRKEQEICLSLR